MQLFGVHLFLNLATSMVCVCTQVVATGDISAICQEKMNAPCKHVFCEDCVSKW